MRQQGKKPVTGGTNGRLVMSEHYGVIMLDFLVTGDPHPCPYLKDREALEEAFMAEDFPPELYHDFMNHGFRRSGRIFYRPTCKNCSECKSLRIPIKDFTPNKSQRRVLRKNEDIKVQEKKPRFTAEKYRMYAKYIECQHTKGFQDSPEDLYRFLYTSSVSTVEFEYRLQERVVAVGIVDECSRSLSSVYTYFDPEFSSRSLGTYSALHEIRVCKDRSIPYYYMGYYINDCPAMSYKTRYQPYETLTPGGAWIRSSAAKHERVNVRKD